jgi:CBS domain-containing protein
MKAADVMVTNVISVGLEATVQDVANILLTNRISAVPVLTANGELLGIVSEGDLMRHAEAGVGHKRPWWLGAVTGKYRQVADFIKEHSRRVADVMTTEVITATPDTPVWTIAHLLEKNAIKRVPIVKDSKVVGIVSRANLLQAMATLRKQIDLPRPINDSAIRDEIITRLDAEPWAQPSLINVIVQDGVVELWGIVNSTPEKNAVRVAAEVTPGVHVVNDNLIIRPADSGY